MQKRRLKWAAAAVVLVTAGLAVILGLGYAPVATAIEVSSQEALRLLGEPVNQQGPSGVADLSTWRDPQRVREVVELRGAQSKTFELATGAYEWVSSDTPIHYKDAAGAWQEIDNGLVADAERALGADYAYRNAANSYTVRFGDKTGTANLVYVEYQGKAIAFGPSEAGESRAVLRSNPKSNALVAMAVEENCVIYPDTYPGVDFIYEPTGSGVREYLVLKDSKARNEFTFDLKLTGVTAKESEGRISFVDAKGETVFALGEPLAVDDARVATEDVTYQLVDKGDTCQIIVTLSREYLDDPARVYPVVLDPEINPIFGPQNMDNYVNSANPTTNFNNADQWLRTGYPAGSGWRRSLIKFDLSSVTFPSDWVQYGYIMFEEAYGANPQIVGYPNREWWSSSSVTWNNAPDYDTAYATSTNYWSGSGWWWKMWTTTTIKKWLSGEWPNYGWTIRDTREWNQSTDSGAWLYSSDAAAPHRPELHIFYVPGNGDGWEMGIWTWSDEQDPLGLPSSDELSEGLRDNLSAGQEFDAYRSIMEAACVPALLRDPSVGGSDSWEEHGFDSVDFAVFADHGSWRRLQFPYYGYVYDNEVRWGNYDLEWVYILACNWHEPSDSTSVERDKQQMAGAHGVCSFMNNMTYYVAASTAREQGATFSKYLRGTISPWTAQCFVNAFRYANDDWQPAGTDLRCFYADGYYYEYLPGHGGMASSDPRPYGSGGTVRYIDHFIE